MSTLLSIPSIAEWAPRLAASGRVFLDRLKQLRNFGTVNEIEQGLVCLFVSILFTVVMEYVADDDAATVSKLEQFQTPE